VAHTPEQRSLNALCGAKKKNGETCRNFAGQGTDHFGVGYCKFHLGNTAQKRKHAIRLQAEAEVEKARKNFGKKIPVDPAEALLTTLQLSAGQLFWLQARLEEHGDKTDFEGQVLLRLWNDERDRVARIAETALRAGVRERVVRLYESYGKTIAKILDAAFDNLELRFEFDDGGLSREVRGDIVRKALTAARPKAEDVIEGEAVVSEG
jgi:hypothetical protein